MLPNETLNKPSILDQKLISILVSASGKGLSKMALKLKTLRGMRKSRAVLDLVFPF